MDFSYRYTAEQQGFRAEVSTWLDRNTPPSADALLDSPQRTKELRALVRKLGLRGWPAPSEPTASGGADLDPDLAVVLLEEMNRRGLLPLIEGEAQSLRSALARWGHSDDPTVASLTTGERTVWRHRIVVSPQPEGPPVLDPNSVGISAVSDADGYILNGTGYFTGIGATPDILWTVALVQPTQHTPSPSMGEGWGEGEIQNPTQHTPSPSMGEGWGEGEPLSLLIDPNTPGISHPRSRTLSPSSPRPVHFQNVWVLKSDALGPEGEGHRVIATRVSLDPHADLPTWVERETEALLDYATTTDSEGRPLSADPIRARILVEAYIASRVERLLRMSAKWAEQAPKDSSADSPEDTSEAESLASLWRRTAASGLSDAAQQVVGPLALLSEEDPNAPADGRFSRLVRRELAERPEAPAGDPDRDSLAARLNLTGPKR